MDAETEDRGEERPPARRWCCRFCAGRRGNSRRRRRPVLRGPPPGADRNCRTRAGPSWGPRCMVAGRIPLQHPQGAERVPAAWFACPAFHLEVDLTGVWILKRPSLVAIPLLLHQIDGLCYALVGF